MSDVTLLIARLRKGAWDKRWPEELLITAARTIQDLLDENRRLRESNIEYEQTALRMDACKKKLAALEVYAGMEGFIPETAPEAYCLRIIEQMNEALQEQTP